MLRLGFIRIMRFNILNHDRFWMVPMHAGLKQIPGRDMGWGRWHVQIAWYWWGFGR